MKVLKANFRPMAVVVLVLLVLGLAAQNTLAQTVSASPGSLSFGIPYGTSPAVSSAQVVTVNIGGSGTVTFDSFTLGTDSVSGDSFAITGNSCVNTLTAPTTCQVSITFSSSSSSTTLDANALTIAGSGSSSFPLSVPLSGAYGAIQLFNETNVTETPSTTLDSYGFTPPYTIASKTLNLTCPAASPTAIIASTPDGMGTAAGPSGYVLVDNYITLSTGAPLTPVTDSASTDNPAGNVCTGSESIADDGPGGLYANCFTANYQSYADSLPIPLVSPYLAIDPDTFTNPGNPVLSKQDRNTNNAGGVPPINVTAFIATGPYPNQSLFTLLSEGGEEVYDNSTLFLVTNCTAPGIVPGASVTLNSVSDSTETQTANLDTSTGQNISFTISDSVAASNGDASLGTGIVPIVTDYPIPQQLFNQLVVGTSSAPAVCLRMSGELDANSAPMCKAFLLQCYDPSSGTTSGSNCTPYQSTARNVLFTAQFASPDGPVPPVVPAVYNYLTTQPWAASTPYTVGQTIVDPYGNVQIATAVSAPGTSGSTAPFLSTETPGTVTDDGNVTWTDQGVNACANAGSGSGIACAPGTGPGLLMGSDNWLCGQNASLPCTPPLTVTTQTSTEPSTYFASNCVMEPPLSASDLCPFDVLTEFQGGEDPPPAGPTKPKSIFIPVVNMPLPSATATIPTSQNGWINNLSTASATFTSSPASYPSPVPATNPSANGFTPATAAPPYSLTYGVSGWPLPDTTYPVVGDTIIYNTSTLESTDLAAGPLCSSAPSVFAPVATAVIPTNMVVGTGGATPMSYTSLSTPPGYFSTLGLTEGEVYYLHYFTTDCAYAEGLVFQPTAMQLANATANWASFPYLPFGVDQVAPQLSSSSISPSSPTYSGGGGWYNQNVTVTYTATDDASGIGPSTDGNATTADPPIAVAPLPNTNGSVLQGSLNTQLSWVTGCGPGTTCPVATIGPLQISDLAGNQSNVVSAQTFQVDMTPPIISALQLTGNPASYGGTPIGVSYNCSDTGSGIYPNGSCMLSGTPTPTYSTPPACTNTGGTFLSCTAAISTSVIQSGTLTVSATDNVQNSFVSAPVPYSVGTAAPTLSVTNSPVTYNGSAQAAAVSGSVAGTVSNVQYSGSSTAPTNAGTYAVTANFVPSSSNYSSLTAASAGSFTINPATPTITFGTAPTPTYPGSNFTVSATTNSNGALSYTYVSGPCTQVSGGTFSPTGVGTCAVEASTAATTNFIAGSNTQNVIITSPPAWTITTTAPCPFFGTLSLGQSSQCVFTVHNPTATATAVKVSVPGSGDESGAGPNEVDPDDYVITTNNCTTVAANGGTCTVTVSWTPDTDDLPLYASGGSLAYLQVANSSKTVLAYATMTGKAEDPTVTLSPATTSSSPYSFGSTSGTETFTLTNNGPTPLYLASSNAVTISGSSDYKLASGTTCTNGKILAASGTCTVAVTFTAPSKSSTVTATVTITDNAVASESSPKITPQYIYLSGK